MVKRQDWIWNEIQQVGKDYESIDEVAFYDESHAKFRDIETENSKILALIEARQGQSLLDIGCGTGAFARAAARVGMSVVGVDVSQTMLAYARQKTEATNLSVDWVNAGFLTLDREPESFDHVVTSFSLHHLPDFYKFMGLRNMANVLKPNGYLFIQDVVISEDKFEKNISTLIENQEANGGEFLREDAVQHFREEFSTFEWVLDGLLERAGLIIDYKHIEGGLLAWYGCRKLA